MRGKEYENSSSKLVFSRETSGKGRRNCLQETWLQCLLSAPLAFLFLCPAACSPSQSLKSRALNSDTAAGRRVRANISPVEDESAIEIILDHEGRVPGGILPDSPKPANLKYGFRSFRNFLDLTSQKVCPRRTLQSSCAANLRPSRLPD